MKSSEDIRHKAIQSIVESIEKNTSPQLPDMFHRIRTITNLALNDIIRIIDDSLKDSLNDDFRKN